MRIFFRLSALLAFFAAAPAMAQGTAEQRAACENDAYRFCEAQVPDAIAVEKCLRANMRSLSPGCRAEFGESSGKKGRR
ncbi:hypothetical protein LG047_13575 [Methylocystis sp. WRRC1]|uniref:hypothetical protein n=1 Tax=unclassified Methylocystis TaxID=2625913 RepID=UPI0001F87E4F|nr:MULTISPECIES: hypothetical protein [unclassified Methylocystis]MCC3246336.1 hypothetical protein [Methylocystis sp. WRRC1]